MTKEEQKVREKIAETLALIKGWEYTLLSQPFKEGLLEEADQILVIPELVILAEDQSFPEIPSHPCPILNSDGTTQPSVYDVVSVEAFNDLMEYNFRRIIVKE